MKKVKNIVKHLSYGLIDMGIQKPKGEFKEKSLVIVRLDAIGDYILFRNMLAEIRRSKKYGDYDITLIGNKVWKGLATQLDKEFVDHFVWVDLRLFQKDMNYRSKLVKQLGQESYEVLFHPTYSRDYYLAEKIVSHVNAAHKLAAKGDHSNISPWQKRLADKKYDILIEDPKEVLFEYRRNKFITEAFLGQSIKLDRPQIKKDVNSKACPDKKFIILFVGGSGDHKRWSASNWILLCDHLLNNTDYQIVLSGGPMDIPLAAEIKISFEEEERVHNLCDTCSLFHLIGLIERCAFMISNETSAPHIAQAVGKRVLVIAIGSHYGRFTPPYPDEISNNYKVLFPYELEVLSESERKKKFSKESELDINSIQATKVIDQIGSFI